MAKQQKLDKHFVAASLIIGACYTIFIVIVQHFVGKDAAGVSAVALSALTVAIIQKFETLRFERSESYQNRILQVPSLHVGTTLFIVLAFWGGRQIMDYFGHKLFGISGILGSYRLTNFVIGFLPFLLTAPVIAWSRFNPPVLAVGVGALSSLVIGYILSAFTSEYFRIEHLYYYLRYNLQYWVFYALGAAAMYYFVLQAKVLREDKCQKEKSE